MNPAQEDALDKVYERYEVVSVDERANLVRVEVSNGSTPYFVIDQNGEVTDEDGDGVAL